MDQSAQLSLTKAGHALFRDISSANPDRRTFGGRIIFSILERRRTERNVRLVACFMDACCLENRTDLIVGFDFRTRHQSSLFGTCQFYVDGCCRIVDRSVAAAPVAQPTECAAILKRCSQSDSANCTERNYLVMSGLD